MAEASKFLSYFGSKRKASSENETNAEKKCKSFEYEFSIIKPRKYHVQHISMWHISSLMQTKKNTDVGFVNNKGLSNGNNEVTKGRL